MTIHFLNSIFTGGEESKGKCSLDPQSDPFIETVRCEVKRYYLDEYCFIETPSSEDKPALDLNTYFTSPDLYQEVEKPDGTRQNTRQKRGASNKRIERIPLVDGHNSIFQVKTSCGDPYRIVVCGEAGSGKSSLCKKWAYDWATRSETSPMKDVPVLFVIDCGQIKPLESIFQVIHQQLLPTHTTDRIKQFFTENYSKIIVVLDGYDETEINIGKLLEVIRNVKVLVTTRPSHVHAFKRYTQIKLDGFNEKGIETYVKKCIKEEEEVTRALKIIRSHRVMNQFAHIPLFLLMICFVIKTTIEDLEQVATLNSLFASFLKALFISSLRKFRIQELMLELLRKHFNSDLSDVAVKSIQQLRKGRIQLDKDNTESVIKMVKDMLSDHFDNPATKSLSMKILRKYWDCLGSITFKSILDKRKKTLFTISDFENDEILLHIGVDIGVLITRRTKISRNDPFEISEEVYTFPHLLFHERCSADYIANHSDEETYVFKHINDTASAFDLKNFLAFMCGTNIRDQTITMIREVLSHLKEISRNCGETDVIQLLKLLFLLNFENQGKEKLNNDINEIITSVISRTDSSSLQPLRISDMEFHHLFYFLKHASEDIMLSSICDKIEVNKVAYAFPLSYFLQLVKSVFGSKLGLHFQDCALQLNTENMNCCSAVLQLTLTHAFQLKPYVTSFGINALGDCTSYNVAEDAPIPFSSMMKVISDHCTHRTCFVCCANIDCRINISNDTIRFSTLTTLVLECSNPIFLPNFLNAIGLCAPSLKECQVICPFVRIPPSPQSESSSMSSKTGLSQMTLQSAKPISLARLFILFNQYCPKMKSCEIHSQAIDLLCNSEMHDVRTGLTNVLVKGIKPISITALLHIVAVFCPNMETLDVFSVTIDTQEHDSNPNNSNLTCDQFQCSHTKTCESENGKGMQFHPFLEKNGLSLQKLAVSCIDAVSLYDLFILVGKCAPNLQHCLIRLKNAKTSPITKMLFDTHDEPSFEGNSLIVTCTNTISVQNLIRVVAGFCPNILTCTIIDEIGHIAAENVSERMDHALGSSRMFRLQVVSTNNIPFKDILDVIETHCPKLTFCEIYGENINVSSTTSHSNPLPIKNLRVVSKSPISLENLFIQVNTCMPRLKKCEIILERLDSSPLNNICQKLWKGDEQFPDGTPLFVSCTNDVTEVNLRQMLAVHCPSMKDCCIRYERRDISGQQ